MIEHLDASLERLLRDLAPPGSELADADVSFEAPDSDWRAGLETLTLNCYLYRVHENQDLRRAEPALERFPPSGDGDGPDRARRRPGPVPIDCSYCITAWSTASDAAVAEEHRLLGEVVEALLRHRVQDPAALWGGIDDPVTPHPVVRTFAEDLSTPGEFWTALEHPVKPSLNCVFTVAFTPEPPELPEPVEEVEEVTVTIPDDAPHPPGMDLPGHE